MGILQDRYEQQLTARNYAPKSRRNYIEGVKSFVEFIGKPPH